MSKTKHQAALIILTALFAIYLIVLLKMTVFRGSYGGAHLVNLIPFITIAEYIQAILSGNRFIGIYNIFGNLMIFVPLGYMAALLLPQMRRLTRILVLALTFSVAIEIFQYILACGATDIDDVILNTIGGVTGYWFYILTSTLVNPKKPAILIGTLGNN